MCEQGTVLVKFRRETPEMGKGIPLFTLYVTPSRPVYPSAQGCRYEGHDFESRQISHLSAEFGSVVEVPPHEGYLPPPPSAAGRQSRGWSAVTAIYTQIGLTPETEKDRVCRACRVCPRHAHSTVGPAGVNGFKGANS